MPDAKSWAAVKSVMYVVPTSRGFIFCNRTFDGSPVFEEPQQFNVRSVKMCLNTRYFYIHVLR